MIDIENCKMFCLVIAAAVPMAASHLAQSLPTGIDKWIERGGSGLCILILILIAKSDREERKERQKYHDEKDAEREEERRAENASSTAAREKLAVSLDRLAEKIEKR